MPRNLSLGFDTFTKLKIMNFYEMLVLVTVRTVFIVCNHQRKCTRLAKTTKRDQAASGYQKFHS